MGEVVSGSTRPNGMKIEKVRVPMGVIGIIFEARPNVTVDGAILCLKSGNAVILRGGKEAINSNKMLADLMRKAVERAGFSPDIIQPTLRAGAGKSEPGGHRCDDGARQWL